MSFDKLGLLDELLQAVKEQGYTKPSPIQERTIPLILEGKDVLASAQTGTGKTAGFTLPMLQILARNPVEGKRKVRALVLTPTRELAAQVHDNVKAYKTHLNMKSCVIFGGVNANPQIKILGGGVDILVATPGRLLDLLNQGVFKLDKIEILVLDEADRMLDMGFQRDINKLLAMMPKRRQNLLFSATFSKEIKKLAGAFLNNPVQVEANPENTTVEKIVQKTYHLDQGKKASLLIKLINDGNWSQALIFTRMKHGANRLCEKLQKEGISAAAIHGNKSQSARTKALAGFKEGKIRMLVATDIAARGLDIPLLPHVVNYELPNVPEDYVHRIGRTGRAGANGIAISLVAHDEMEYVRGIEKLLGHKLESETVAGFEPSANPPATENSNNNRGGRNNSSRRRSNNNKPAKRDSSSEGSRRRRR